MVTKDLSISVIHYLQSAGRPCIVAIDEFQQIDNYAEKNVEALLRTYVQQYPGVRFVFAGSQRHLMSQMFSSPSRPFYQSVSMMSLDCISVEKYICFARRHFANGGRKLADGVVESVFELAHHVTWYVQKLMNTLYSLTPVGGECTCELLDSALQSIIGSLDFGYRELMFRIPEKQGRVLIALAKEGPVASVTAGSFVRKYHLNSSSTVQSAMRGLLDKDYVTFEQGRYSLYDIFLAYWLQKEF